MVILLIVAGIIIFIVSTYEAPIDIPETVSVLEITSPIIPPSPVERAPEPIYTPALNGEVLLQRPVIRPVSTF